MSKIGPLRTHKLAAVAIFASLAICQSAFAQQSNAPSWNNARVGGATVVTQSANDCANVCSASAMCASYSFRPFPVVRGGQSGGQCQFNRTSVPNFENGVISGLPSRMSASAVIAQAPPPNRMPAAPAQQTQTTVSNYNGTRGANYSVAPLERSRQSNAMALNNLTIPTASPNSTGAAVSFERPNASPTNSLPVQPAAQRQTQPQPRPSVASPRPTQTIPTTQTAMSAQPSARAPASQPATNAAPLAANVVPSNTVAQQQRSTSNTSIEQFRGPDGMIDAAEMRRAQLRNQQAQNTPHYSVQNQWTSAADEQLTGRTTEGVDWTQTRPVQMERETAPTRRETRESASNTETSEAIANEIEQSEPSTRSRGPLRKRAQ